MKRAVEYVGYWLLAASLLAVVFSVYDKWAAKHATRHRVPERQLWLIAALGGAAAMWLVMQFIRHKTKHRSFMVGLPCLVVLQAAAGAAIFYLSQK